MGYFNKATNEFQFHKGTIKATYHIERNIFNAISIP